MGDAGLTPTDGSRVDGAEDAAGGDGAAPVDVAADADRYYPPPVCPIAVPRGLTFGSSAPGDVVVVGEDLFFFGADGSNLFTIPVAGGTQRDLNEEPFPSLLRAQGGHLAYVNTKQTSGVVIELFEIQRGVSARHLDVPTRVLGLDLTEEGVYFIEAPATAPAPNGGVVEGAALKRWPWAEATSQTIRAGLRVAESADLRVVGNQVFWRSTDSSTDDPTIATWSLGDLALEPRRLAATAPPTAAGTHRALAVDDTFVYYAAYDPQTQGDLIQRVKRTGGGPQLLARTAAKVTSPVVIDDAFVYWVAGEPMAVRKTGGAAFGVVTTPGTVCPSLVADGKRLICMNAGGATVIPAWWRLCSEAELTERVRACETTSADAGAAGAACAAVAPTSVVGPRHLAATDFQSDGETLFFAVSGTIRAVPLAGGAGARTPISDTRPKPNLRVRGKRAAYARRDFSVVVIDLQTGLPVAEAPIGGDLLGLALADDGVYWIEAPNHILKRKLWSAAGVEVLREGLAVREPDSMMNVVGNQVFWITDTTPATLVSWTVGTGNVAPSTLATLTSSATSTFLYGRLGPRQLAADDAAIYFIDDQRAQRVPRAGGAAETLSDTSIAVGGEISIDDAFVYWIAGGDGAGTVTATRKDRRTSLRVLGVTGDSCEALVVDQRQVICPENPNGNGEWTYSVLPSWWRTCDADALAAKGVACGLSGPTP